MGDVKIKLFDNGDEWLEGRKSRIGGSDAGSIMGVNPWKDNVTLWREKTGLAKPKDLSGNKLVDYGKEAETYLRSLFELDHPEYIMHYKDFNMWSNEKYPFAHASLDGWLEEQDSIRLGIWECKTTEIASSSQWEKWDGRIPDTYYCQILHYMAVTGFDFAVLTAQIKYRKDGQMYKTTRDYHIERSDVQDDIDALIEEEKAFYDCILNNRMPNMKLP